MINREKDSINLHEKSGEDTYSDKFKYLFFGTQIIRLNSENPITPSSVGESGEKLNAFYDVLTKFKKSTLHILKESKSKRFNRLILSGDSYHVKIYQIVMAILLGYSIFTTLIFMSIQHPVYILRTIDIVLQFLFMIQIPVTFLTDYRDNKHRLVRSPKKIALRYLKGWFFIDLVTIIPLRLAGYEQQEYILRQLRVLKFPVVLSVLHIFLEYLFKVLKHHLVTTSWIRIRFLLDYAGKCIELIFVMFFMIFTIAAWFIWFSKSLDAEDSFVSVYFEGVNDFTTVLTTCYFILTTLVTVGYGDYVPQKSSERVFIIIVMLIGIALFAFLSGSIHSAIFEYHNLTSEDNLDHLNTWINSLEDKYNPLSKKIKKRITQHFLYFWDKDRLYTIAKEYWNYPSYQSMKIIDQPFLRRLPIQVTHKILDSLFGDIFYQFDKFFHHKEFQYEVCFHIQPRFYHSGEVIVDEGEKFSELVLVVNGEVSAGVQFGEFHKLISFSHGRTILGDFSIFTNKPTGLIYKATGKSDTEAFVIPKKPLLMILKEGYPEWYLQLFKRAALREQKLRRIKQIWSKQAYKQHNRASLFLQAIIMYTIKHRPELYYPKIYKSLKQNIARCKSNFYDRSDDTNLSDSRIGRVKQSLEEYQIYLNDHMKATYKQMKQSILKLKNQLYKMRRTQMNKMISTAETYHTDKEDL